MSASAPSIARTPSRTAAWSSTTSTRTAQSSTGRAAWARAAIEVTRRGWRPAAVAAMGVAPHLAARRPSRATLARRAARGARRALGLDEPPADRVPGQLDAVAQAELLEDVRAMALDGLLADRQELGDVAARVALGDELDDLDLARRQRILAQRLARPRALEVVADQRPHRAGVEERLAAHRGAARLDEVAVGDRLEHVAGGAGAQRLVEVLLGVVHRQDQHAQPGAPPAQLVGGAQAAHARHRDVEDREVDVVLERALDRLGAVAGLGDDPQVGLRVEDEPQAATHDDVVVGEQDSGRQRYHRPSSLTGTCSVTSVPSPPPRAPPCSPARISAARSRTPRIPPLPLAAESPRPQPSSRTRRISRSGARSSASSAREAPAWRTTFVSASCATR